MIHARIEDAKDYLGIHPRLDRALELLTPEFLASVGTVQQDLEEDRLYVTRFDYETVQESESFFEAHRRYLDIHIMVQGSEYVDIARPEKLEEFTRKGDFWGYRGEKEQRLLLKPGDFLVVFPADAHRLKIAPDAPRPVSKVVFKVLIS